MSQIVEIAANLAVVAAGCIAVETEMKIKIKNVSIIGKRICQMKSRLWASFGLLFRGGVVSFLILFIVAYLYVFSLMDVQPRNLRQRFVDED